MLYRHLGFKIPNNLFTTTKSVKKITKITRSRLRQFFRSFMKVNESLRHFTCLMDNWARVLPEYHKRGRDTQKIVDYLNKQLKLELKKHGSNPKAPFIEILLEDYYKNYCYLIRCGFEK